MTPTHNSSQDLRDIASCFFWLYTACYGIPLAYYSVYRLVQWRHV